MRISDWSSDVCSSDLAITVLDERPSLGLDHLNAVGHRPDEFMAFASYKDTNDKPSILKALIDDLHRRHSADDVDVAIREPRLESGDNLLLVDSESRSEEHTSELQSLMRISYAVFCLKKKNKTAKRAVHRNTHNTSIK